MLRILPICCLLFLALASCRKEDSSELAPGTPIYQDLKVVFDKPTNRTRAFATFRRANSWGVRLQLTGGSSITFNGQTHNIYTELDNYFYRWNTEGMVGVVFRFNKEGAIFENSITLHDTIDVRVPADVTLSLVNGGQVFWDGLPLQEGERLQAWLKQGNSTTSKTTVDVAGAESILIPASTLSNLSAGTADLHFARFRTEPLQEGDGNAGGRRIIEVEARGTIALE
jgi:hypothetical protein